MTTNIHFLPGIPTVPLPLPYANEDEILYHITQFLPREIIRDNCSLVNRSWYEYCTSNTLWKYLTEIDLKIKFDIQETKGTVWRKIYFGLIKSRWRWRRATSREDLYDQHFKAIIMGDKKVGKSSVLMRLAKKDVKKKVIKKYVSKFQMSELCTSLVDMNSKETVKLQFYDSNIIDMATYIKACRNFQIFCHAIVIVFSVDKKRTFFNAINKWLTMIQKRRLPCNVFLVANKCDIPTKKRMVTSEEAALVARTRGLHYIEMSAANGRNSEDLLTSLCNILYRRLVENESYESLWPDIIMAQNAKRPESIRFFHSVVPIPSRKPIDLLEYRDVYTYDSDYSDDEDDMYLGFTQMQMIKTNTVFDEEMLLMEQDLEQRPFISIASENQKWMLQNEPHLIDENTDLSTNYRTDDDLTNDDDENYAGSDADDEHASPPPKRMNDESDDEYAYTKSTKINNSSSPSLGKKLVASSFADDHSNRWGGLAFSSKKSVNRYDSDSGDDEDSDDSDENVDEDVPLSSFKAAEEYHPTFNLNSVIREDKGIKTKAVHKTFKATDNDSSSNKLSRRVSDMSSNVSTEDESSDIAASLEKSGLKHLGSGLIDDYLVKAMQEEQKQNQSN